MTEPKMLFDGGYICFWDNGEISVNDGVGYTGTLEFDEVLALFMAMQLFYSRKQEPVPAAGEAQYSLYMEEPNGTRNT